MLFLSAPADRGKIVESHGIFFVEENSGSQALQAVESLTCISREITARLTLEEILERLVGDDCELSLEEDSDYNEDRIYDYMAEVDNDLSLADLCSEGC